MSQAFYVHLKGNVTQTGIAVHTETQPVPTKGADGLPDGGIAYQGIVHVLWDDPTLSTPAPSFHSPTDLVHLGIVGDDLDALDDGEEEETEEAPPESEADASLS
jgi:hypothetical protein